MERWHGGRALWSGAFSLVFPLLLLVTSAAFLAKPVTAGQLLPIELTQFPLLSQKDPANYRDRSYLQLTDTIPGSSRRELVPNLACLAAVYTMIARGRGERSATIDTFYPDPRASGGSTGGANRPPYVGGDQPIDLERILASLRAGNPVVLYGEGPPLGTHFVLVVGMQPIAGGWGQLIVLDPFPGKYQTGPGKRLAIRVLGPGSTIKHPSLPVTFRAMRLVDAGGPPAVIATAPPQPRPALPSVASPAAKTPQPMFAPSVPPPTLSPPAGLGTPVSPTPSDIARLPGSLVPAPPPRVDVPPSAPGTPRVGSGAPDLGSAASGQLGHPVAKSTPPVSSPNAGTLAGTCPAKRSFASSQDQIRTVAVEGMVMKALGGIFGLDVPSFEHQWNVVGLLKAYKITPVVSDWSQNPIDLSETQAGVAILKDVLRKQMIRPLNVVAYSWGAVIAYIALVELENQKPEIRIDHLVTIGTPIDDLKQPLNSGLRTRAAKGDWVSFRIFTVGNRVPGPFSGKLIKKPLTIGRWTNFYAAHDPIATPVNVPGVTNVLVNDTYFPFTERSELAVGAAAKLNHGVYFKSRRNSVGECVAALINSSAEDVAKLPPQPEPPGTIPSAPVLGTHPDPSKIQALQAEFRRMASDLQDLSGRLPGVPGAARPAIVAQLQNAQIHLNRAAALLQAGDTSQAPIELSNAQKALGAAREQLQAAHAPPPPPAPVTPVVPPAQPPQLHQELAVIAQERSRLQSLVARVGQVPEGGQAMGHLESARADLDSAENSARRGDQAGTQNALGRAGLKINMVAQWLDQLGQKTVSVGQQVLQEVGRMRAELADLSSRLVSAPLAARQAIEQQLASAWNNINIAEGVARADGPQVVQARIPLGNAQQALDAARKQLEGMTYVPPTPPTPVTPTTPQVDPVTVERRRLLEEIGRMRGQLAELRGRLASTPGADRRTIERHLAIAGDELNRAEIYAGAANPADTLPRAATSLGNAGQALAAARQRLGQVPPIAGSRPSPTPSPVPSPIRPDPGQVPALLAEIGRLRAELGELSGRLAAAPAAARPAIEQQLASARTNLNIAEGVAKAGGPQVVQARIPLGNARQALDTARRQLK